MHPIHGTDIHGVQRCDGLLKKKNFLIGSNASKFWNGFEQIIQAPLMTLVAHIGKIFPFKSMAITFFTYFISI